MAIDPTLTLEQLKKLRDDAFTQKSLFEQALVNSPSADFITFNNKKYSYADALAEIDRLNKIASQYQKAYDNKKPKTVDKTLQESALTQDLQTAQRLAGEAFATLTQEITVSPSTSKPFKERYNAALQNLSRAENAAIKGGLDVAKTTTATIAEPTTAEPSTMRGAEALAAEKGTATGVQDPAASDTATTDTILASRQSLAYQKAYVDAQLKAKGLADTPENRKTLRTAYQALSPKEKTAATSGIVQYGTNVPPAEDNRGDAAVNQKAYVDAQLKAKGLADTPENRKTLRAAYQALSPEEKIAAVAAVPGAKIPPVVDNAWEQLFIKNNPAKAWYLTELDRAKYPQLFAILKEYALARPLTVEEQAAFAAKLDGTDFFRELSTSGKIREIKNVVGDLGFDGSDFTKFVHTAINMGYTGDRLKEETYKEVFKKGDDGKYINPIAFKRVIAGNDYLNVKLIGKQYFNEVSSDTIEKVLTGEIGSTDVQRQQRYLAGQKYQHLDNLLEQGLTLQDIASSYQTSAAKLLEVDPNTIDMSAADYEVALNFGEEGKKRMMTSGEWDRLLRTESKYGWEKTNNAKQEARGLASSLVQAFGRII